MVIVLTMNISSKNYDFSWTEGSNTSKGSIAVTIIMWCDYLPCDLPLTINQRFGVETFDATGTVIIVTIDEIYEVFQNTSTVLLSRLVKFWTCSPFVGCDVIDINHISGISKLGIPAA